MNPKPALPPPLRPPCPDEARLLRAALGDRTDGELAELEAHLDGCGDCRRVVAAAVSEETLPAAGGLPVLRAGARVGRYQVEALLGVGGMGIVYAAQDRALGRRVAIKLLRPGSNPGSDARLAHEAQTMARLSHPNVVPVFDLGEWEGQVYLAMELVEGLSLDAWRRERPRRADEVLRALLDAARGLSAAHRAGVVHRDFKPGNVLVGRDGRVRVTDFGLSRATPEAGPAPTSLLQTQAGALIGTPAYMAPEQLAGQRADARSDQFSFCVTLVEALSGARPFAGGSLAELQEALASPPALSGVPRALRAPLARGLSLQADRRFESVDALADALVAALSRSPWGRTRALAVVGLSLTALLGGGLGLLRMRAPDPDQVEVATVSRDLEPGAVVTQAVLGHRAIPRTLHSSTMVNPDQVKFILDKPVIVPVMAGDVLLWTAFSPNDPKEAARRAEIARASSEAAAAAPPVAP